MSARKWEECRPFFLKCKEWWNTFSTTVKIYIKFKFTIKECILEKKKEVVDHVVCGMNIDGAECKGLQSVIVPGNLFYTAGT